MRKLALALGLATAVAALPLTAIAAVDDVDEGDYKENAKALIGKVQNTGAYFGYPAGLSFIYEVAVDQLKYRNGNSHKAWFIPESSKGLVVFVKDLGTNQGVTNSAPNIQVSSCPGKMGPGSYSFDDADVPFECDWQIGTGGNAIGGTFQLEWKRGGPGVKAINNTNVGGLDSPESSLFGITQDAKTFSGSFVVPDSSGPSYDVTVKADRVKFRNGVTHREFVIPESNKKDDGGFGALGGGYRVQCPFDGPGLETFDGSAQITCTWKAGYGDRPSGTVVLE